MKPTDEQINQACAELCGWKPNRWIWINPEGKEVREIPNYATDRNALPELWKLIEAKGLQIIELFLCLLLPSDEEAKTYVHKIWKQYISLPRLHCIAALKACGKWPDNWEV